MLKIGIFGRFLAEKKCIIEKENSLETLIAIVERVFFLTECEEFRNFSFYGEFSILTCRQPLLIDVCYYLIDMCN